MALDNGHAMHSMTLPTPTDSLFDPSILLDTRRRSRHGSTGPFATTASPIYARDSESFFTLTSGDRDFGQSDKHSSMDSRRFTSDLDNSLIQQIHTLRLELDGRTTVLTDLEDALHRTTRENEQLSEDLSVQAAEGRSLRKQMQLLESGTLSALGDIARERDNAVDVATETRKRLEATRITVKSQEAEADKMHNIRENELESWAQEKGTLERTIQIMENRLRTMVSEMISLQSSSFNRPGAVGDEDESIQATLAKADVYSVRSESRADSRLSNRSHDDWQDRHQHYIRAPSRLAALHELGESRTTSLAEELAAEHNGSAETRRLDLNLEDWPNRDDFVADERDQSANLSSQHLSTASSAALPEEMTPPIRQHTQDNKARKVMGLPMDFLDLSHTETVSPRQSVSTFVDYMDASFERKSLLNYKDSGTQYSSPASPVAELLRSLGNEGLIGESSQGDLTVKKSRTGGLMIDTASQTVPLPINRSARPEVIFVPAEIPTPAITSDSWTQTAEDVARPQFDTTSGEVQPSLMEVPVIAIHPPGSRPNSSRMSVMLPPRTRNMGCQVSMDESRSLRSFAVQTDGINELKRAPWQPPRSHLAHIATQVVRSRNSDHSLRTTDSTTVPDNQHQCSSDLDQASAPTSDALSSALDLYPGINDDGPLNNNQQQLGARRPIRSESIFAGFSDEDDNLVEMVGDDFIDNEYGHTPPIRKTLSKVKDSWKLVPQDASSLRSTDQEIAAVPSAQASTGANERRDAPGSEGPRTTSKTFQKRATTNPRLFKAASANRMRDAEHNEIGSTDNDFYNKIVDESAKPITVQSEPPFPVPTRFSSRKGNAGSSDGTGSPTPYTTSFYSNSRRQARAPATTRILRKIQSEATVTRSGEANKEYSPAPASSAAKSADGPATALMSNYPRNQFILPIPDNPIQTIPPHGSVRSISQTGTTSVDTTTSRQSNVVDAIAQTMVGEWMWKYVRKRTSFGITESAQAEFDLGKNGENGTNSGVRHKRWVWLAPYERAVMWSGKQPTSGPALLGKGGRKLAIQSVLDVKDNTPLPKGQLHEPVFDRSILILTPERAIKFTATTRERHYIWLTALSFLSSSNQQTPDMANAGLKADQYSQHSSLRRSGLHGSLRSSKAFSRGPKSFTSPPSELDFDRIGPMFSLEDIGRPSEDAAEPPQIPRVAPHTHAHAQIHTRKRSSTGPRIVPITAFHTNDKYGSSGLIYPATTSSSTDLYIPTARDRYEQNYRSISHTGVPATSVPMTITSGQSSMTRTNRPFDGTIIPNDAFDAVGTVRMEAFIDDRDVGIRSKRSSARESQTSSERFIGPRVKPRKKKDLSYWGVSGHANIDTVPRAKWRGDDPFGGF